MKKINKKKLTYLLAGLCFLGISIIGITYAAFADKSKVLGSTFSVGSSDIKLLSDLTLGIIPENLEDDINGPTFNGISPNWQQDYLIKIYNNSPTAVDLSSNAYYETINDPEELRQIIYVEPIEWLDENTNGLFEEGEEGTSYGVKTIIKWKTEGYLLGQLESGGVKSLILRFSTDTVADSKQGATAVYDFEFDSVGVE